MRALVFVAAALIPLAATVEAQSIAREVSRAPDGEVRLAFTPREGICGDGSTFIRDRNREGFVQMRDWSGSRDWRYAPCQEGPVRVSIRVRDGAISSSRVYVGGAWARGGSGVTDLGYLPAPEAARGLLELARRADAGKTDDLIFAATIADSVTIWPVLMDLARDRSAPRANRKQAVFWMSQAAGDRAAEGLRSLVTDDAEDQEVREQAVFALSQLPREEGVPILIRVARTNADPKIRRKALFWLGQSEDPRALALFEEILTKPER